MICVRLMGGLGNQMFQYAAGRALAIRHQTILKLDLSFLQSSQEGNTRRVFMLDQMRICAQFASPSEMPSLEDDLSLREKIQDLYLKFSKKRCNTVLLEFENRINSLYFSAPNNSYLVGYWQSERYFEDISPIIRKEFVPVEQADKTSRELAMFIGGTNSVSVHIRRGDYASNPRIGEVHGVCPMEYYEKCIDEVVKVVDNPHFFLFSDEPEWARRHINIPFPLTIVDQDSPEKPIEDLRLMSLCKHNIIANSSFSWWGAWLNGNPRKIVFAPKRWFASAENIPEDLIPSGWQRI